MPLRNWPITFKFKENYRLWYWFLTT